MKNKKMIILILILIISTLSITGVTASDGVEANSTDTLKATDYLNADKVSISDSSASNSIETNVTEKQVTDESVDINEINKNVKISKNNNDNGAFDDVKYNTIDNIDNSSLSSYPEVLGTNSENNVLGTDQTPTSVSLELTKTTIKIKYRNLASYTNMDQELTIQYLIGSDLTRTLHSSLSQDSFTRVQDTNYYLISGECTISKVSLSETSVVYVKISLVEPFYDDYTKGSMEVYAQPTRKYSIDDCSYNYNSKGYDITGYVSLLGEAYSSSESIIVRVGYSNSEPLGETTSCSNGKFTLHINQNSMINLGANELFIYDNYFGNSESCGSFTLTITKAKPTISVSSTSVNYNTGTYSVSGTCNANGLKINLKAGSTSLGSATVSNGKWTVSGISSTKFNPDSYTLTATSTETDGYQSASATNTLTVSRSTPTVTVTNKNINYNSGTYTLGGTVKVDSNNVGTGTVTIYKNDVVIGTASVTSSGSWTSSSISSTLYDVDTYTIKASYASNTYYNANSGTGTLIISKVTPTITVSTSPDIKYGNGVYTVSGTAKYGSNNVDMGTVTLKQGSTVLGTGSVSGGLWTVSNIDTTLVDPSSSAYTITAYYENNVNYNAASATNSLTVSKFTPDISIESTNIWYNQSGGGVLKGKVYTYNGDFYSGFIDLYVNGELVAYNVVVSSSGNWSYTLSSTTNLSPGLYSVRVDWKGNEYTNSNSFTDNRYIVNKGMVIPIITPPGNIDIGRSAYVYVDVNNIMGGGYLGGMTVTLQGNGITGILEEISDVNGRATFSVPSLGAGKYDDWKVCVVSNDYYYPTMDIFKVGMFYVQYPITITITSVLPSNSTYPEEVIIKGFSDADNPQGNVTFWLGGKNYTGFFDSTGNFTASLVGVKPATYNNITTKYNPTEDEYYYRGVESVVSIPETVINKYLPEIKVLASSITNNMYPGNVTITGTVKGAQGYLIPSGRIEALYNGRVYGNAILDDDGSFVIYAYDLPRGEYNLTINYVGDDYYLNNTQSTENFTVNPSPVKFNITVVNGTYNVDEVSTTIQVELSGIYGGSDIAKGIIRLEINGRYWDATIDDTGRALVEIKSLNAGDYSDVILRYIKSDDELSFVDTDTTVDFTIFKADPGLSVRAPTIGAGKDGSIFITLNDNVSGVVNLTVGNFNIILNVTAGQNRTYVIPQPPVGANRVIANYSGDVNFNSSIAETMLYIERPESYLNYTVTNISYGQSEDLEFKIYLDEDLTKLAVNATGTIRVYGLDKNYKVDVTGGLAYLSVDKLTKGTWTIVAIYSGNDELGGSDKDDKFTVTGISTPLTITVDNSSVIAGNDIIVTVSVNDTINDPIKLYVDGKLYYFNATVNGVTSFVLRNLSYASYNITAVFDGNDGFEGSSNNTTVSVYRIDVNPNIDISYNRDIVFNITVPSETSGNIRIKGNGTDTLLPITDNRATLTLYNVTRGDYKFNISYDGNWKYLPFNTEKTFTVNPVDDYNLTIESTTAEFNKTVTITVTAFGDLEGKFINLTVDGVNKGSAEVIDGLATFNNIYLVSNTTGEFKVIASYDGDNTYASKSFTLNVPVIPTKDYIMGLKALDLVYVGDNILINITAPELINTLNITINGKTQLITCDNFTYHIDDIDEGEYNILVSYAGDKAYASKTNTTSFNVIKKDSNIIIETGDVYYNEDEVINISVSDGVSGYVLVNIDNKTSKYDLNANATQIIRNDFTAGLHNVTVVYPGDRKYNSFTKTGNFTVFKDYDYNMVVSENGTVIGNNSVLHKFVDHTLVVDVALPSDATGNLSFKLYDINHNLITNWTNVLPKNLINYELREVTNYTLEIFYTGDSNYENNTFVFDINVHKFLIDADASFVDNPYFVLSDSLLNITSNLNDRQIRVYIDGIYYTLTDIIHDNKTVINLAKLSAGNHTVSLMYNGDEYYTSLFATHNITVFKLESSVNVTASSVRTDNNVIVDVNASGSGSANIVIFNNTRVLGSYNITVNDGKGSFIIPLTFVEGTYNLNITYYGDDVYYGSKNTTVFTVTDRIQSVIDFIEPAGYIVNKTITIGLRTNFPTGEITVYVDGKKQTTIVNINNNEGTLDLGILSNGNHTIQVTYGGNYNYTETSNNITIDVLKLNTTIAITVDKTFYVDDLVEITINVNKSATGYISVNVNNKDYRLKITEGVAKLNITDLKENTYTIYAEYLGDDYFYSNNTDDAFTVSKIPVSIVIPESIVVGDDLVIDFTNTHADNDEITGVLNITIGSENIIVNVVKGMASIPVSRLPEKPDTYDVVANYSGNYKFNNTILNTALMIKKLTTHTASADANVTIDENLTVIITGDRGYGVDGNLTVSVNNGDSFIIPVNNGIAVIPSDKLPQETRDNTISISYANGTFYADKDFTLNVHSDKITVYDFIISNATICFGENATLEINLPKDVTTSLTVKINDDTKTVNINDGYGKLENINNLHAGDNSVTATFTSGKYETSTANANILVVPNDITLNITVPSEQLYVDQSATINVKANVSMNNSVTVYVNGKAQTVNLTNGEGGFTIDPLVYGDYVFTAIFDGNENYTYTIASEKSFSVDKNNITLNVTSSNVIVGHDVNIKVNINDDATGLVIVKVNNVEYSLNVTNNEYTLSVPNLGNGTYTILAKYYGDSKYYGFENTTTIEVLKLTPSISANDTILIGENLIITVENATSLVDKATGKLNLTIDNFGIIEADVVNGIAVIKASDLPQVNNTYTASVEYTGDNNYYSLIQAITFTINKVPEVIITVPSNVTIDDELIITVGDSTTDGKLNVIIGSGNEFSVEVVKGIAVIPVSELPQVSDNYNISIYYHGGSYWNNLEYNTTFHADKITVYPFNITNPTIMFGENATLEITLPNDVNTTLTVKINDITSTVDIKNGYGKLENISGLHAKANSVSATFGNGKYETSTVTSTIQVDPNDMTLTITVPTEQLYVDQSALISIKANVSMNNTVTVYVNGKAQTVKLTNGEGGFTITPLVYGDYVFTAIFDGNENYTYTTAGEKSFSVDKINITLNVTSGNVVVGHDINIKVNINDDATGLVIVKVDSTEYSLNVGNKEYSLGVSGLGNGTHNIVVKYYGDDKYYGDENSTTVEILKLTPSIAFSSDILIAEDFIISITNSSSRVENPSGKLIFTINGNPVEVDVVNGVATIKASDLPVTDNTYTALVEYSGDNNYYPLTESVTFTINKVPRLVITVPGNVTIDDELIISVGDDTTDGKLNVTIGSGEKFTVNVINGTATIPVKYLPQKSNIYAIALDYYDGSYWNDTSVVRSFHADKIVDYPFIISNDTIKFDGIATLRFTLPSDVNTTLTVIIDDIVKTVSITDGHGVLSIANLHVGVNLVSTSFGNEKYETSTATSFIRVLANEITLNITVPTEQLYVDQSATVSVQANVSMNNSVIVYVNGEARTLNLSNGKAEFTINPLVYGKYVFTALFEGNENYTRANAEMKSFTVDKNTPAITVSVEDILVDEDALVTISNLPEDSKGIVLININGTVYSINTVKGKGNLTVPGLKYGKYNVTVNFTGDDKYHSNINTTSFSVWKNAIGEIKVRSETIKDNKTQVTVTVEKHDATGEVIITTPNGEYIGKFLDGKTVIEVTDLSSVETPFNITYVGDAKYLSNTTNGVIVNEGIFIESWVTVSAPDIMVDEKTLITVNVPDDATGFVKITVNGKTIQLPLVDAVATFKIGDLPAGEQTITVTYLGDDKYYNNTNSTTFHVNKYSTSISVEADDGMAGTPTTVTVKANASDVNGNVTVTVNGVNWTAIMENGIAVLNVTIDNAGDNVITAVYEGNTYYNTSTASGSVNMDYADAFVNVDAGDINVGEDAVIIITLPDDATGNVTLTLNDNNDYKPVIIENGTAKFSISDLSADTYNVVVKYLGDNKYNPKSNGTVFVVSKVEVSPSTGNNTSVEVIKNDNGTTTINITVPDDATGNVTVTVDGKNYTVPIVNGTASVTVDNLNNDSNVSITYSGDDKYDGFNQTTVINSDGNVQFTPTLTITTQNINVGDTAIITVNLPVDATGSVSITVNGKTYTEAVSNGSAVFNVSGLSNATHIITASYNGDKKYLKVSNTSSIAVSKIKTSIGVKASDINVGDTESITVTVNVSDATGSVSITVDGKDYTSSISNGQAVFSINALAEGTYTIKATYNGDNKYLLSSNGTVSFTVSKNSISPVGDNKTSVEVTPNDNGTATVTVNVPSDATGNVTVTVDGKNYTVPVVNGTASVVVDDYTNGSNISVSYSGDDKYDGFNHTGVLSDDGVKFNIDMTVTSDKEVYVAGETAVITITLPEDSTGNVTIMVNNKPVDTVLLSSGNIVFDYVIPSKGGFTVEAVFNGDKKYTAVHNSTVFTAVKANSTIIINVDDTPYDKNPVIEVILPDDAGGNVTITVGGKDYTEEVSNGKAVFNLPLLDRDTYTVTAVYSGDDKYNGNNNQSEFDVVNKVADLDIKVDSIVYGETANVTVTTSSDVSGYVTVSCGDNTYFAFIENGTAVLSVPNLESGLNNITVYYSGDDEYQEKTVTSVIPVARLSSSTEVFVDDITQGDVLNVTVRVSGDASGNVTVTIDGKNYTGTLDNGMVIIPVHDLLAGNYSVTALYLGDKYYNESSDVSNFLVKANMTVFAYEMTRGYNSGMDYSVYLTDDLGNPLANTSVVISVGGVDYNVRTDGNGIASLNAKLPVGSHTISIVNPVTGEETHSNLTIAPRLIENKNIVTYYNSGYVYKVRVLDDDGNPVGAGVKFTIKINGKSYTYTTDKNGCLNIKINKRFTASSSKKNRVYKISLSYKGYTVKNTITIKQVLKSKRIVKVKKSAKRIVLKAKLKQGKKALKGKVIKFKFKGKTYKAKTNKKGIAKVKISKKVLKKLKAGKNYKVKITYLTDTIKTYVKVKK